jgi:CubicO group peptidase (beta-lactamase class C family)
MAPEPWPVVAAATEAGLATIGPPQPDDFVDPDTWIARFGELPLMAQPGERWLYNTGAHVLSVLCARAVGASYDEVLRTRIFEPLGMRDTGFYTEDVERLATAYRPTADGLEVWDSPDGQWSRRPSFHDGAAGLLSTVDDLLAFARMLARGGAGVLSPESVREMSSDQLTDAQKARGGLGAGSFARTSWGFCQAVYDTGAFGWNGGFGTSWRVDPARDLTVIVCAQRLFESYELPEAHRDIQAAAYAALG